MKVAGTAAYCCFIVMCTLIVCGRGHHWSAVPGTLKHVSISYNYLWGVNSADAIYVCARPCTGAWKQVKGSLKQVDVGEMEVWGVNKNGYIYKASADGSTTFANVKGRLKHVSASGNGYIWGVTMAHRIYKCKKPCKGSWIRVGGLLAQIDGGEEYVFGVNKYNNVYSRPVDGSGKWTHIPGKKMKYVSAGSGEVFGVDTKSKVFKCKLPCKGGVQWEEIDFCLSMNQVEATVGELAATAGTSIFTAKIDYIY